ncbi:ATP-binding cassette domain-containing protein [Butyrivibrio sp. FC2001]|uniref:ATP-binding cassette domain-containing protein n=1 Tax=Butyrivibrio sp. FC2001 TaxID=1280671 RepID=UPI00042697F8|nr:ABC transporter ATP-binding protein [Butyrivibrio sp. FC2001]
MWEQVGLNVVSYVLASIGCWNLFKKCGVKSFWAVIPVAREYHISLCADKEEDGRTLTLLSFIYYASWLVGRFINSSNRLSVIIFIFCFSSALAMVIIKIRVYWELIKVFKRNKKWIIMFFLFEGITLMIWGLVKGFVPSFRVDDLEGDGAKILGQDVSDDINGLTINLKSRTSWDFFKKKTLLKDIHMNIPKGHMVLLLGGSGAGKTTFLNAITGYEKADAKITLGELDIYDDYEKIIYDVGFVPQQDLIRGNDTVWLTLADAATLRLPSDTPIKERFARVDSVLEQFGLTVVRNNLVDKLSGGQRKRVSIAMEYISDPTLFILDEPDSGLDGVVARSLFEKLRDIANDGKIVIVITHTPDRVADLFDDVIVLIKDSKRTGRIAFYGTVEESYKFFEKDSMEGILRVINPINVGGDGRGEEFVEKYADLMKGNVG